MTSTRYLQGLTIVLVVCCALQASALRRAGGRAVKSESNYFSSLARLQFANQSGARMMLAGSSMTGRLPDQAQGFANVANMGIDAGSAVDVLRAMDRGLLVAPPVLVVEGNTLYRGLERRDSEVLRAVQTPWFRLGERVPVLSAGARPAAFLYSQLLAGRTAGRADLGLQLLPVKASPAVPSASPDLAGDERDLVNELAGILARLGQRGTRTALVLLPPRVESQAQGVRLSTALAAASQRPLWDLNEGLPLGSVMLTDAIHMDAPSAAATMRTLKNGLDSP